MSAIVVGPTDNVTRYVIERHIFVRDKDPPVPSHPPLFYVLMEEKPIIITSLEIILPTNIRTSLIFILRRCFVPCKTHPTLLRSTPCSK